MVTYGGKPAFTQFGSSNGGWTSAGSMPYLVAKADPYDGFSGNPVHTWTKTVKKAAVQKAWPSLGTLTRVVVTQRDGHGEWYGRVETLVLDGTKNDVTISRRHLPVPLRTALELVPLRQRGHVADARPHAGADTSPITAALARDRRRTTRSSVPRPQGARVRRGHGRARRFQHGRIFWSQTTGAHELYKRVLRAYLRRGGAAGDSASR